MPGSAELQRVSVCGLTAGGSGERNPVTDFGDHILKIQKQLAAILLLVMCLAPGVAAQPAQPAPTLFGKLFQKATDQNGYEELVRAADLVTQIPGVDAALEPVSTLEAKRRVLGTSQAIRALELMKQGLEKPVLSPREEINENTLLPEFGAFRKLGRLIAAREYVMFADGRIDSAMDTLHLGLLFAYRIQTDSLIAGLVGIAIDTLIVKQFSEHLDQLSVGQSQRLTTLMTQFMSADNPGAHVMLMEKTNVLKILEARRGLKDGAKNLIDMLEGSFEAGDDNGLGAIKGQITADPQAFNGALDGAEKRINVLYDQAIENLTLPAKKQKPLLKDESNDPGAVIFRAVSADPQKVLDKYVTVRTRYRLLAIHGLIHRYKWEHGALPGSLEVLKVPELLTDAITERKISYSVQKDRYELTSEDGPVSQIGTIKL